MVEKVHALKDRETMEAWLTENSIDFHVSSESMIRWSLGNLKRQADD